MKSQDSEPAPATNKKRNFTLPENKFDHSYLKGKSYDEYPYKRSVHPFLCRLKETAGFTVTSPLSLVSAGFASIGMGLFTLFRPTPLLLFSLVYRTHILLYVSKAVIMSVVFFWQGLVLFVLIIFGIILTHSHRIKKRWAVLIHPWGLLLLYFDVFVWILVAVSLHLNLSRKKELSQWFSKQLQHPTVYFIIIYIESICFGLLHWAYATYFITAELSIIDRFY